MIHHSWVTVVVTVGGFVGISDGLPSFASIRTDGRATEGEDGGIDCVGGTLSFKTGGNGAAVHSRGEES